MISKEILYPEIEKYGSLSKAIADSLNRTGSSLALQDDDVDFVSYARVELGDRFSQIYIAKDERLFTFDFWAKGVCLANGVTSNIDQVSCAIDSWISDRLSIDKMSKYSFFVAVSNAKVWENGGEVELSWNSLRSSIGKSIPELEEILKMAYECKKLRQLFPYTSMNTLALSRCTGYPYSEDMPYVAPQLDGSYKLLERSGTELSHGNPDQIVKTWSNLIPDDWGHAVPGTRDEL